MQDSTIKLLNNLLKSYSKEELLETLEKIDKINQSRELNKQKRRAAEELTNFVLAILGKTVDTQSPEYQDYFNQIFRALTQIEKEISTLNDICGGRRCKKDQSRSDEDILKDFIKIFEK